MVATITVYFHPARSQGSMVEAVLIAIVAFLYALVICFSSMGVSLLFGRSLDLLVVGHAIVLVVFCGGGLGFVGWIKQRLAHPLVNIGCSLTSLAIITVLTKEGAVQAALFSDDKIIMVLKMIVMGVISTTAVSTLISPISARTELRQSMIAVTDSFGELLAMITKAFLTGSTDEVEPNQFHIASEKYKSLFASMTKNLMEAKYEYYLLGREREFDMEARLVNCMQKLGQDIGGLRSAASTQFLLLAQGPGAGNATPINGVPTSSYRTLSFSMLPGEAPPPAHHGILTSIDEIPEDDSNPSAMRGSAEGSTYLPTAKSPGDMFSRFIDHLGPSMVRLL